MYRVKCSDVKSASMYKVHTNLTIYGRMRYKLQCEYESVICSWRDGPRPHNHSMPLADDSIDTYEQPSRARRIHTAITRALNGDGSSSSIVELEIEADNTVSRVNRMGGIADIDQCHCQVSISSLSFPI
jgi:hypothetical protein